MGRKRGREGQGRDRGGAGEDRGGAGEGEGQGKGRGKKACLLLRTGLFKGEVTGFRMPPPSKRIPLTERRQPYISDLYVALTPLSLLCSASR